jgi:hypothetical protein
VREPEEEAQADCAELAELEAQALPEELCSGLAELEALEQPDMDCSGLAELEALEQPEEVWLELMVPVMDMDLVVEGDTVLERVGVLEVDGVREPVREEVEVTELVGDFVREAVGLAVALGV